MHSHVRISWGYDTVRMKGRTLPVAKEGSQVTYFTENQRAPYS